MDYKELVSSLESEALAQGGEKVAELCAQSAAAITALHNRASELEADIEDLLQDLAIITAARLRVVK